MKKDTLLLFDGNALAHRAFHAFPSLVSPQGKIVGAVYGFFSIFLSQLDFSQPEYAAVAFDLRGPTFRNKLYPSYKAKRVRPPQQFYDQIPIIKRLLAAMEVPILAKRGYEADDVIGSFSRRQIQKHSQLQIIIVSPDQDIYQLIKQRIKALEFKQGKSTGRLLNETEIKAKTGLSPNQVADFKALAGDGSDNIPGVPGIGQKTAQKLLQTYKTLKNVYRQIDEIKPDSLKEKLRNGRKSAFLSKELSTICLDIRLNFALSDAQLRDFNRQQAEKELTWLGFRSLIKRLPDSHRKKMNQTKLF